MDKETGGGAFGMRKRNSLPSLGPSLVSSDHELSGGTWVWESKRKWCQADPPLGQSPFVEPIDGAFCSRHYNVAFAYLTVSPNSLSFPRTGPLSNLPDVIHWQSRLLIGSFELN